MGPHCFTMAQWVPKASKGFEWRERGTKASRKPGISQIFQASSKGSDNLVVQLAPNASRGFRKAWEGFKCSLSSLLVSTSSKLQRSGFQVASNPILGKASFCKVWGASKTTRVEVIRRVAQFEVGFGTCLEKKSMMMKMFQKASRRLRVSG